MSNSEPKENINRRSDAFRKRMKDKGFVGFFCWVPRDLKEKVKEFVKSLTAKGQS